MSKAVRNRLKPKPKIKHTSNNKKQPFLPNEEYDKQYKMKYVELCIYLQEKYGTPSGNYFLRETCKSKNKNITRTEDGLFVHHIREDCMPDLGKTEIAVQSPWEYQLNYNLVYCNYIEHLILHIKIVREFYEVGLQNGCMLGVGGVCLIRDAIRDAYSRTEPYKHQWRENVKNAIKEDVDVFNILKEEAKNVLEFADKINIKYGVPYRFSQVVLF